MSQPRSPDNAALYKRIRVMSNSIRFRILELTQDQELTLTELSSALGLSYTKCADYVRLLEKQNLVQKTKEGREVKVKSRVRIEDRKILFT